MCITVLDSIYNNYNVILLFVICLQVFVATMAELDNLFKRQAMATRYARLQ